MINQNKLLVKKSQIPGAGKGLFTNSFIKKGSYITEYFGEIIDVETGEKRMQSGKGGYILNGPNGKIIDSLNTLECFGRYVNDAEGLNTITDRKNNAHFVIKNGRVYIRAIQDIPKNEEVFVGYGQEYWEVHQEVKKKLLKKKKAKLMKKKH